MFRVVFIVISLAAIGGATYVSWYGYGAESTDTIRSIRAGSGGAPGLAGRVK
jgi:uncharacterized membrane protein